MKLRALCLKGDFAEVEILYDRWARTGKGTIVRGLQKVEVGDDDQDTDGDSVDDEDDDEEEDAEMAEAPPLREKVLPEIDEDGFTKVVGKKKR